jgi:hypothetical protein
MVKVDCHKGSETHQGLRSIKQCKTDIWNIVEGESGMC